MTLERLCAARGLTLAQLAARAGVPAPVVTKIAAGAGRVRPVTLRRLAAVLYLEAGALRHELHAARASRWGPTAPPARPSASTWRGPGRAGRAPRRRPA